MRQDLLLTLSFLIVMVHAVFSQFVCDANTTWSPKYKNDMMFPEGNSFYGPDEDCTIQIDMDPNSYVSLDIQTQMGDSEDVLTVWYKDDFTLEFRGNSYESISLPPPVAFIRLTSSNVSNGNSFRIFAAWTKLKTNHSSKLAKTVPDSTPRILQITEDNVGETWVIPATTEVALTALPLTGYFPHNMLSVFLYDGDLVESPNATLIGTLYECYLAQDTISTSEQFLSIQFAKHSENTAMLVQDAKDQLAYSAYRICFMDVVNSNARTTISLNASDGPAAMLFISNNPENTFYITSLSMDEMDKANLTVYSGPLTSQYIKFPLETYSSDDDLESPFPQQMLPSMWGVVLDGGSADIKIAVNATKAWALARGGRQGILSSGTYPNSVDFSNAMWEFASEDLIEFTFSAFNCILGVDSTIDVLVGNDTYTVDTNTPLTLNATELTIGINQGLTATTGCLIKFSMEGFPVAETPSSISGPLNRYNFIISLFVVLFLLK